MPATIGDVARRAGVSTATVSRVLAGRGAGAARDPRPGARGRPRPRLPAVRRGALAPPAGDPDARPDRHRHREPVLPAARPGRRGRGPRAGLRDPAVQRRRRPGAGGGLPRAARRPLGRRRRHRREQPRRPPPRVARRTRRCRSSSSTRVDRASGCRRSRRTTVPAAGSRPSTCSISGIAGSAILTAAATERRRPGPARGRRGRRSRRPGSSAEDAPSSTVGEPGVGRRRAGRGRGCSSGRPGT